MLRYAISLLVLFSLVFVSCVMSLYPLTENEKDIVFKKELLGRWKETNDHNEYIVDTGASGYKSYRVTLIGKAIEPKRTVDTSYFLVMLVHLKDHYYLDCMPDTSQLAYSRIGDWNKSLLFPCHFIIRLYSFEKYFIMSALDPHELLLLLKNKKVIMKHERIENEKILLMEKPEILQQKILGLEYYPTVYNKDTLTRIQ